MFWGMSVYNVLQFYLPIGAELISPKSPPRGRGVRLIDVDEDGIQEIIALYRYRGKVSLIILKDDNKHWTKLGEINGRGYDIDHFNILRLDNNTIGVAVGWEVSSKEKELDIYSFKDKNLEVLLKGAKYNKLNIEKLNESKIGIILWRHVLADAYNIEILSHNGNEIVVDKSSYPSFYKKVVDYYRERIKELPRAAFYWYYLADSQIRANMIEDALISIEKGLEYTSEYPTKEEFEVLLKKIKD